MVRGKSAELVGRASDEDGGTGGTVQEAGEVGPGPRDMIATCNIWTSVGQDKRMVRCPNAWCIPVEDGPVSGLGRNRRRAVRAALPSNSTAMTRSWV